MIGKLYFPNFFPKNYETKIEAKLKDSLTMRGAPDRYTSLLALKVKATHAAASFSQLKSVLAINGGEIPALEGKLERAVNNILENKSMSSFKNELTNRLNKIKTDLNESNNMYGCGAFLNLMVATIAGATAASMIGLGCFMAATGPGGIIALGIGIAVVSAVFLLVAAYTLYVEGRFLANKQIAEIESFVEQIAECESSMPIQKIEEVEFGSAGSKAAGPVLCVARIPPSRR